MRGNFDDTVEIVEKLKGCSSLQEGQLLKSKIEDSHIKRGDIIKIVYAGLAKIRILGKEITVDSLIFLDKNGDQKFNNLRYWAGYWEKTTTPQTLA